jgi:PAS domain S-box-containing protein
LNTKKTKKQLRPPLPGATNVHIANLPNVLVEAMKTIKKARRLAEGADLKLCRIYREAVGLYIKLIDLQTGSPKQQATKANEPTPRLIVPMNLPVFHESVNCNQFADDALLREAVDRSWMMVWMADTDDHCVHVSPLLVAYTGLRLSRFMDSGWIDIMHPEDREKCLQNLSHSFKSRQSYRNVYRMMRVDGLYAWVIDQGQPRYRPDGSFAGYIGTVYQVAGPDSKFEILVYDNGHWSPYETAILPDRARAADTQAA